MRGGGWVGCAGGVLTRWRPNVTESAAPRSCVTHHNEYRVVPR